MKKTTVVIIILAAAIIALAVQIVFGNFLSARLSTLPLFRNLDLFNPRAPIVVTNRETVRVSDANDAIEASNNMKSKLSLVVYYDGTGENSRIVVSGGALNWTSDGYFVTSSKALSVAGKTYAVVLNNGDIFPVKQTFLDTASDLMILSTDARNLATVESIKGSELRPGEKIILVQNAVAANKTTFLESYLRSTTTDVAGITFDSDVVGRVLSIQQVGSLVPGHAAINLNGRLAGMWDGSKVVTADAIRTFAENFFQDNLKVVRPGYGFTYTQLSGAEARALQLSVGARVAEVETGSPAADSKLETGDMITSVNGQKVDDEHLLEELLVDQTPGTVVTLEVMRNGKTATILITPSTLE